MNAAAKRVAAAAAAAEAAVVAAAKQSAWIETIELMERAEECDSDCDVKAHEAAVAYHKSLKLAAGKGLRSQDALAVGLKLQAYGQKDSKAVQMNRLLAQGVTLKEYNEYAKSIQYGISLKKLVKYYEGKGFRFEKIEGEGFRQVATI